MGMNMTAEGIDLPKSKTRVSLTDQAYERIRRDIVSCVLQPGLEFTEIDIAARLSMSKTPVREALMRLQFDGLVRAYPRRGYVIEPVKISDINDIFDMRVVIEAGAMELAVKRISEAELERLSQLADSISDEKYNENPDRSNHINIEFHETIARASRNVRLHRSVIHVLSELERFFYIEAQASVAYPDNHASHRDIVSAILRREVREARAAIIDHVEGTRSVLLNSVMESQTRVPVLLG
jgi:DNA-binding GntR family transcriptional regulator